MGPHVADAVVLPTEVPTTGGALVWPGVRLQVRTQGLFAGASCSARTTSNWSHAEKDGIEIIASLVTKYTHPSS